MRIWVLARDNFARMTLRVDKLITHERLRLYPILFAAGSALGITLSSIGRIVNPTIQGPLMPDYLAHWTGGGLLLFADPAKLYEPESQFAFQTNAIGSEVALSWFVSPPIVAAFYAPLAMLPYNVSAMLWLIVSTALLLLCVLSLKSLAPGLIGRKRGVVMLAVLASPPVFELLGGGQDSAFILGVWLAGIRLFKNQHNIWAGAVLALGIAKPQLVVLVPLILLVTKNFRALASFFTVCGLLLGTQIGMVGFEGVLRWLGALSSPLYMEHVQQGQAWKMVGLPSLVQGVLPDAWGHGAAPVLTALSLPVGAGVLLFKLYIVRGHALDPAAVWIAALATTAIFSPHLATYDAVLFIPVIVFLLERRPSSRVRVSAVAAFGLLWLVPVLFMAANPLAWPLGAIDAPWSAIPFTVLWLEALRALAPQALNPRQTVDTNLSLR